MAVAPVATTGAKTTRLGPPPPLVPIWLVLPLGADQLQTVSTPGGDPSSPLTLALAATPGKYWLLSGVLVVFGADPAAGAYLEITPGAGDALRIFLPSAAGNAQVSF